MYTLEEREFAIEYYVETGLTTRETVKELGYPSHTCLCDWLSQVDTPKRQRKEALHLPYEDKLKALSRCFELGESLNDVAAELGLASSSSIRAWRRIFLEKGELALMTKDEIKAKAKSTKKPLPEGENEIELLRKRCEELELENAIRDEIIKVLKKGPGVDPKNMSNKEKMTVIDALLPKCQLKNILITLSMARSSYYYCKTASLKSDKYFDMRITICELFEQSAARYGSERIWLELQNNNTKVSEKVVRRLMHEEKLVVVSKKERTYKSYQGEITPAPDNLIKRDFHADNPDEKWLTDITEMKAKDGKIYLSPIVDCFDGKVVAHTRGLHPTAELANTMLFKAIKTLDDTKRPILHSDCGCHYRWPDWIAIMDKNGLTRSMSKKGCSPDNSACEGFFGRLKNEMYYGRSWEQKTVAELMQAIDEYIEWYNEKRIKKSLGAMSPNQYRQSLGLAA
jgi:transposase InsO family protein/transposase-like protein